MKVMFSTSNNQKNPTFQSRNAEIRYAEDIMRRVNKEFTRISPAKINETFGKENLEAHSQCLNRIAKKLERIRGEYPAYKTKPNEYALTVTGYVKRYHLGNCGESGALAKIGFAVNGIKTIKTALHGFSAPNISTNLDYTLTLANLDKKAKLHDYKTFGKKAIVIDQWGNNIGYAKEFFENIIIPSFENDVRKRAIKTFGVKSIDFELNEETIQALKEKYPNLITKKHINKVG